MTEIVEALAMIAACFVIVGTAFQIYTYGKIAAYRSLRQEFEILRRYRESMESGGRSHE